MGLLTPDDEYHPFESKFYDSAALREFLGDQMEAPEYVLELLFQKYNACPPRETRPYDIVFYGASGYTGRLLLQYLRDTYATGPPPDFTFAVAGRNADKVRAARDEIFTGTIFADVAVEAATLDHMYNLKTLITKGRVFVNLTGPYLNSGAEAAVEACILYDTDYVDINGELPFTHELLQLNDVAIEKKVFAVPNAAAAGGIPDLVTFAAVKEARNRYGADQEIRSVVMYVQAEGAELIAPSGGTLATRAAMANASNEVKAVMVDPFALGGRVRGERDEDSDRALMTVSRDDMGWRAPYNYAFMETRVVRRSNYLHMYMGGRSYGHELCFQEYSLWSSERDAQACKEGSGSTKKEEEDLKKRGKYYAQGEGPKREDTINTKVRFTAVATTEDGQKVKVTLEMGDAYYETAHVAVETALALVKDRERLPYATQGGVLTPSVAGGSILLDRLVRTGMKLTAE